jgi:hypothetical protein
MHQNLQLKASGIIIRDHQARRQAPAAQRHRVYQVEVVAPQLPRLGAQARRAQAEVEFYREVGAALARFRLGRRFPQELPRRRPREAVLREVGGRVRGGWGTEDLLYIMLVYGCYAGMVRYALALLGMRKGRERW